MEKSCLSPGTDPVSEVTQQTFHREEEEEEEQLWEMR